MPADTLTATGVNQMTVAELEARVKLWQTSIDYRYAKKDAAYVRTVITDRLTEALLMARENHVCISEVLREIDGRMRK